MSQIIFKNKILPLRQQLLAVALKMLSETQDAEDAVQETLLKIWNQRSSLDKYDNVTAFTITVCKNLCIDRIRARSKTDEIEMQDWLIDTINPHHQLELTDDVSLIKHIILTLPKLQQMIITLKDVDGYEVKEIAEIVGANEESVRVNLSRARKKVREQYLKLTRR